jgi:hypothetical protein
MTDPVLDIIRRGNQRGGRALSVIDLVEAGTLDRALCAWLLDRVLAGSSWLVGARPGGAGKTTVMNALLAMAPGGTQVHLMTPGSGWERARPGECVVAYEVSPHALESYVWGEDVQRMTRLALAGCRIVSNLHADTLAEARAQVVDQCGAGEQGLRAFGMFLPIRVSSGPRGTSRVVERVEYVDADAWRVLDAEPRCEGRAAQIAEFLKECRKQHVCEIEEVRTAWLAWLAKGDEDQWMISRQAAKDAKDD